MNEGMDAMKELKKWFNMTWIIMAALAIMIMIVYSKVNTVENMVSYVNDDSLAKIQDDIRIVNDNIVVTNDNIEVLQNNIYYAIEDSCGI